MGGGGLSHRSQWHFGNSVQMETYADYFFTKFWGRARLFVTNFLGKIIFLHPLLRQFIFFLAYSKPGFKKKKKNTNPRLPRPKKIKWSTPNRYILSPKQIANH